MIKWSQKAKIKWNLKDIQFDISNYIYSVIH